MASSVLEQGKQIDAAPSKEDEQLSPVPVAGMARRRTRSQAVVVSLDDAIAELIYAENLPNELVDSPHWHKLLNLMRSAPAEYEPPERRRLEELLSGAK